MLLLSLAQVPNEATNLLSGLICLLLCLQYEPELFPGLIYRMLVPKVVLLIFVSGKVVLTGKPAIGFLAPATSCAIVLKWHVASAACLLTNMVVTTADFPNLTHLECNGVCRRKGEAANI